MKNFKVPFSRNLTIYLQKAFLTGNISLLISIFSGQILHAQQNKRLYQKDYDVKTVKFGYFIGMPYTHYNIKFNNYFVNQDNIYSITSPGSIGLKIGGLANIRLNDYFDFRVLPTVALVGRKLEFKYVDTDSEELMGERKETRESAWFELPVMLKYKSERRGNVRMFIFGGLRYGIETNAGSRKNSQQFKPKANDLCVEYGTGLEIFREYFKFSPELHFSHGLVNLINPTTAHGTAVAGIDRLTTHTVTLYLSFE